MVNKKQLLKELEKEFEDFKKEIGFNPSLEELNLEFSLKNDVLSKGFVPEDLSKYFCSLIADYFRAWHGYLNGLLVPNSNFYANQTEAKLFNNETDRKLVWELIGKAMEFSSESALISLSLDKEKVKKFIEDSYGYCISEFRPSILEIMKRVNEAWRSK
jgi:hypothetical protein